MNLLRFAIGKLLSIRLLFYHNLGLDNGLNFRWQYNYREHDQSYKAEDYINQTGFIAENAWSIIGPFNNVDGIGYNKAYIPEDAIQIDMTAKYDGVDGQIGWEKRTDDTFDGFVDLDKIFASKINWVTAYARITVTAPDEREAQIRLGGDDQAKVWLNGEEVFTYGESRSAAIDQNAIPVTLKAGENSILIKVCDERGFWGFYLRLTDIEGGALYGFGVSGEIRMPCKRI